MIGAGLGLAGVILVVTGGKGLAFQTEYLFGYSVALVAALTWSSYSVISRRFASVPSVAVTGFCLVASALAALCHLMFEATVWPATPLEWAATIGLGLGPAGGAFFLWDRGVKKGDIQVLGAAPPSS
jgi:drug/metabolite transporter (DMT)-like permease